MFDPEYAYMQCVDAVFGVQQPYRLSYALLLMFIKNAPPIVVGSAWSR